jgi:hypothetical protein
MKPMNASESDRIKKLEARVAALEESNWALREILAKRNLKERLYEKLRPKITRLQHYRPRELNVPEAYGDVAVPARPPTFAIVTPSYNQASFIGATGDKRTRPGLSGAQFPCPGRQVV